MVVFGRSRNNVALEQRPGLRQPLADDEVEVRVQTACITQSDWESAHETGDVPGRSAVGIVEATGTAASHMLAKRVAIGPVSPCGECERCRSGAAFSCADEKALPHTGTLASHLVRRARWVLPLEDGLDLANDEASLIAGPAADAYWLYIQSGSAPGDSLVVLGDGVIAALVRRIGHALGSRCSTSADEGSSSAQRVVVADGRYDIQNLLRALAPGSTASLWAPRLATVIDFHHVAKLQATIATAHTAHPELYTEVAALVAKGALSLQGLLHRWTDGWQQAGAAIDETVTRGRAICVTLS